MNNTLNTTASISLSFQHTDDDTRKVIISPSSSNTTNNVLPRVFFLSSECDEFVFRAKRDRLFLRRRDDDDEYYYCE